RPLLERVLRRRPPLRLVVTRRAVRLVGGLGIDGLRRNGPAEAGHYDREGCSGDTENQEPGTREPGTLNREPRTENREPGHCFFAVKVPSPRPAMLTLPFSVSVPSSAPV